MKQETLLLAGAAVAAVILLNKKQQISGVGAIGYDYAKFELDREGIDLSQDFYVLNSSDLHFVWELAKKAGYRQGASSKAQGISYGRAFWYAMQRHFRV